jgi:hypothetical protein
MRRLSLLHKIVFVMAIISVVGSIISGLALGQDVTWQGITLLWVLSAVIAELRIKELEDKS